VALRLGVRPGEWRDTAGAFLTLFGVLAGHSLLETARDALFLASIPAVRLPLVYLGIAAVAVAVSRVPHLAFRAGRFALGASIAGSAAVTLGLWALVGRTGDWTLYVLYIWSGLLSSVLVVRFWLLAGDTFTVTQAKRLFALIGTGGILGAVVGSALAQAIAVRWDAERMVLAAAAVLLATSLAPAVISRRADEPAPRPREDAPEGLAATLRAIWRHDYVRHLGALLLVSTITLTLVDLVFKTVMARSVQPAQLAWLFALIYLIVNVLSLVAQLTLVAWMTRSLGLDRLLAFLPALVLGASVWFAAGGALLAAVLVKVFDGTLRHSLHRTATEVLSVPLPSDWRRRVKAVVDVVGQRGGQAVASLAFLAVTAAGIHDAVLGTLLAALCVLWIVLAVGMKQRYFDLFRSALEEGAVRTRMDFPDLDLASLETLIGALSSPDEAEVIAALDLLAQKGRIRLVPPLVLYHPSAAVVVRALELFDASGRTDHRRLVDRLLTRPEAEVRTAALLALPQGEADPAVLERALQDESAEVRATALVGLYCGENVHPRVSSILETLVYAGSSAARQAVARAIARRPDPRFDGALLALAGGKDPLVAREVARAMRASPSPRYVVALRAMLALRDARDEARSSLVAIGEPALDLLASSLADETVPDPIRRHIPRTLMRFDPQRVAPVLLARLNTDRDGIVRFKVLRALGHLRTRRPGLPLDSEVLDAAIESTLERIFRLIDWRVSLARDDGSFRTLLVEFLEHKEAHAVERLFRLFSLRYPREDFKRIYRGVSSADRKARASGRELLESVLRPPLRDAVGALLDDLPDAQRLAAGRRYYRPPGRARAELLRTLLRERSLPLRCIVAYHVAELGLSELRQDLVALCEQAAGTAGDSFRNALARLDDPRREPAVVAVR
jgi:AAA family ATP:ADP antiporter